MEYGPHVFHDLDERSDSMATSWTSKDWPGTMPQSESKIPPARHERSRVERYELESGLWDHTTQHTLDVED